LRLKFDEVSDYCFGSGEVLAMGANRSAGYVDCERNPVASLFKAQIQTAGAGK
jgi:hypothetical protein